MPLEFHPMLDYPIEKIHFHFLVEVDYEERAHLFDVIWANHIVEYEQTVRVVSLKPVMIRFRPNVDERSQAEPTNLFGYCLASLGNTKSLR